jgi:hypothetical protein
MSYDPDWRKPTPPQRPLDYRSAQEQTPGWRRALRIVLITLGVLVGSVLLLIAVLFGACALLSKMK